MMYSREELIQICKDAVVPFYNWGNRDSYSAQRGISDIHGLLVVGAEYDIEEDSNERTIWITFKNLTDEQKETFYNHVLNIDSRDDYFEKFGYDSEMFDGYGIDVYSDYLGCYIPTRKRLEDSNGGDWY